MQYARKTRVLLAALLMFGLPAGATAQVGGTVSLDLHGGLALPTGTLGDLTSLGAAYGAGLAWHFHPNVALRGDVLFMKLDNGRNEATGDLLSPPVDMLYYGGGIEVDFNAPLYQDLPLTFAMNVEVGLTQFEVDETFVGPPTDHPAETINERCEVRTGNSTCRYLTFTFGGQIGYTVLRNSTLDMRIFVKGQPYLILTDSADMLPYAAVLNVEPFDHVWMFPLTAGVRLIF